MLMKGKCLNQPVGVRFADKMLPLKWLSLIFQKSEGQKFKSEKYKFWLSGKCNPSEKPRGGANCTWNVLLYRMCKHFEG